MLCGYLRWLPHAAGRPSHVAVACCQQVAPEHTQFACTTRTLCEEAGERLLSPLVPTTWLRGGLPPSANVSHSAGLVGLPPILEHGFIGDHKCQPSQG